MILYCIYIDILISQYILYTLNTATIYWYNKVLKLMLYFFFLKLDIFLFFQYHRQTGNDASWLFLKKKKTKTAATTKQDKQKIFWHIQVIFIYYLVIIKLPCRYKNNDAKFGKEKLSLKVFCWQVCSFFCSDPVNYSCSITFLYFTPILLGTL